MAFRGVVRRPGQPQPGGVRTDMGARLGANLSDVRIHTDAAAHRAAQAVNAQAFTAGSHIAFQRSQYNPVSAAGRHTLAHELTHVLQQRSGLVAGTAVGGGISASHPADHFERAAEANARRAMAGRAQSAPGPDPGDASRPVTPAAGSVPVQRRVGGQHAYLSADNGNVEYVTDPLDDRDDVVTAVGAIADFHESVGSKSVGSKKKKWDPRCLIIGMTLHPRACGSLAVTCPGL